MRDGYIQQRTLETEKFPTLVIVPKRAVGLPAPLPVGNQAQAGFQLVTDMTLHGVTKEVTWNVVSTFGNATIGGRATTTIVFSDFNLTKPTLARLLSVDDKIQLEIEFRCTRDGDVRTGLAEASDRQDPPSVRRVHGYIRSMEPDSRHLL